MRQGGEIRLEAGLDSCERCGRGEGYLDHRKKDGKSEWRVVCGARRCSNATEWRDGPIGAVRIWNGLENE